MPIYAVKNTETGQLRLAEAKRPISAINHVVGTMFTCAEADARDGVELGRQGGTVEIAGETPPEPEPEQPGGYRVFASREEYEATIPDAESDEAE